MHESPSFVESHYVSLFWHSTPLRYQTSSLVNAELLIRIRNVPPFKSSLLPTRNGHLES